MSQIINENLPNFLLVGAPKAGSTTFADMLKLHPQVFASEIKELHYFDYHDYHTNQHGYYSCESKNEYCAHFENSEQYKIRTEFTPGYLYCVEAPDKILNLLGKDTKIMILLRNPTDRAFSEYMMKRSRGDDCRTFEETYRAESQSCKVDYTDDFYKHKYNRCFERGLYAKQVQRYLDRFPHVKIILFEDFIRSTDSVMEDIYEFLEIDNVHISLAHSNEQINPKSLKLKLYMSKLAQVLSKSDILKKNQLLKKINRKINQLNSNPNKQKIDPAFAKVLQDYYHDDICALEKLINRDLTAWKTKY